MPKLRIRRKPDRRSLHTKTMFYTTKGLILRETQYKDNDKLLDVLTGDMGRITVKARGVRAEKQPAAQRVPAAVLQRADAVQKRLLCGE